MFSLWAHLSYFLWDFKFYLIILFISGLLTIFGFIKIFRSRRSEKTKAILLAITFSAFFCIFMFSSIEAFFRYKYDESDGLGFLNTNSKWMARHVVFNTYGYRDHDFSIDKKSGVTRIGVLGDSLTMGAGIKNVGSRFSNLLENKLISNGIKAEVYNVGQSGVDTCGEIKEFDRVKQLKFDIIIWEYFVNDVQPCEKSTGEQIIIKQNASINPIIRFLNKESYFFNFIYYRFSSIHDKIYGKLRNADLSQYNNPKVLKQHLDDVASLSANLQENSSTHKVVVIFFPSLFLLDKNYSANLVNEKMDKFFIKQNDLVLDMLPYLIDKKKQNLMVNRFDSHPNEYVNDMAANLLYGRIVRIINEEKKK